MRSQILSLGQAGVRQKHSSGIESPGSAGQPESHVGLSDEGAVVGPAPLSPRVDEPAWGRAVTSHCSAPKAFLEEWQLCGMRSLDLSQSRPRTPACHQGAMSFSICHSLSKTQGERCLLLPQT